MQQTYQEDDTSEGEFDGRRRAVLPRLHLLVHVGRRAPENRLYAKPQSTRHHHEEAPLGARRIDGMLGYYLKLKS